MLSHKTWSQSITLTDESRLWVGSISMTPGLDSKLFNPALV